MKLLARCAKRLIALISVGEARGKKLVGSPLWNNSAELEKMWEPYAKESVEVLGTAAEAREILWNCRYTFSEKELNSHKTYSGREYDRFTELADRLNGYSPDHLLGYPDRVSHLRKDSISLGYVLKKHSSGYVLENLEALDSRLVVLRFNDDIVAAYLATIIREEHYRGMHSM
jgi:hypothetical protein